MKIVIKNLGALKQAEFSLGDMTIICGRNNTGKTYATYALFGFLTYWRECLPINVSERMIDQLLTDGTVQVDITEYSKNAPSILDSGCVAYAKRLPVIFAAPAERFKESQFIVTVNADDAHPSHKYERRMRAPNAELFSIIKAEASNELLVTLLVENAKTRIPRDIIKRTICEALKDIVFGHLFPTPFIASAERTGAAIFRKDLNFARNRLLEEMTHTDKDVNPLELLFKVYQDYALPVKINVDFTRQLEALAKKKSFVAIQYPEVLNDFVDIIGGEYTVTRNDELYYVPKGKHIKLTMDESSSAVRSLLDIGFYLRHMAKPGDLLIVDEPELNLHPENQRRVARLFARLVNIGVKVFITTHSDYIIKELNTLIMLSHDKPHLKRIAQEEGYKPEELISSDRIRVYIAEEALIRLEGGQRRTRCQTLRPADIDPERGVEASSFDVTIETMNRIQEEIVWGME
ncbi:AAA family ATPase [Acidiferrobacter sp.]|uniref:AAA family ATPase n=1 Tax=Acidiferrobacter sp. TaxID=1872107 RepID=UPI00263A295C|nr:AAA family ATPase [Acidiferrobacter sp.]